MDMIRELLDIGLDQIGTKEDPAGSNRVKYNTWFYGSAVSGSNYPWCMVFAQWLYYMAHFKLPVQTASCSEMMRAAKKDGSWKESGYQKGDLVLYDWTESESKKDPSHCGVIYNVHENNKTIQAIEGNTSLRNQSNGGEVMLRTRRFGQIRGVVRPKVDEEWLQKRAYEILKLGQKEASSIPTPELPKEAIAQIARNI